MTIRKNRARQNYTFTQVKITTPPTMPTWQWQCTTHTASRCNVNPEYKGFVTDMPNTPPATRMLCQTAISASRVRHRRTAPRIVHSAHPTQTTSCTQMLHSCSPVHFRCRLMCPILHIADTVECLALELSCGLQGTGIANLHFIHTTRHKPCHATGCTQHQL